MEDLFKDTWALVTGASGGIGEEFARQLAAKGVNLVLAARSEKKLAALAAEIEGKYGVKAVAEPADLAVSGGAEALVRRVRERGIEVDHLINNAGYGVLGPFVENDLEEEVGMLRLNCESLQVLCRLLLPGMIERKRGGILNVSSVGGFQPVPYFATYGGTKAFVQSFTEALRMEVGGAGVRVTAVAPRPVRTGFNDRAGMKLKFASGFMYITSEKCARVALRAYVKKRASIVHGLFAMLSPVMGKITLHFILNRVTAYMYGEKSPLVGRE